MKNFKDFMESTDPVAKKCPKGKYYCFTDKKCKKIPTGYRIGYGGPIRYPVGIFLHFLSVKQ